MGLWKLFLELLSVLAFPSSQKEPTNNNEPVHTQSQNEQTFECLQDLLRARAECLPERHVLSYALGSTSSAPRKVSYGMLYNEAKKNSTKLGALKRFKVGDPVLIHLDDRWDAILWFWTVLLAHGIPVLSSPLSNVEDHRHKNLQGLSQLLQSPLCITRAGSLCQFEGTTHAFELHTVESLLGVGADITAPPAASHVPNSFKTCRGDTNGAVCRKKEPLNDPAVLMLTSGSTGNAKAVPLTHKQILASVSGKASIRARPLDDAFLNWIGIYHVAALIEIHIQALWLGVNQVHLHAADVFASPRLFLDLLSRHRISRTFAPNFLLAKLVAT
ncbi:hypothetical protein DL770_010705 [Monosporascus sp. CRB-9-2]|nr:hypothetical protein DL770_010705 [Monosporascus sp. CRB-9-2]